MAYQHDDQAVIGSVVSKPWQETLDARTFAAATQRPSELVAAAKVLASRVSCHGDFLTCNSASLGVLPAK